MQRLVAPVPEGFSCLDKFCTYQIPCRKNADRDGTGVDWNWVGGGGRGSAAAANDAAGSSGIEEGDDSCGTEYAAANAGRGAFGVVLSAGHLHELQRQLLGRRVWLISVSTTVQLNSGPLMCSWGIRPRLSLVGSVSAQHLLTSSSDIRSKSITCQLDNKMILFTRFTSLGMQPY
ncbi:unnamed protein product [Calypogeia fissa]